MVQVSSGCPRKVGTQSSWMCLQDTLLMLVQLRTLWSVSISLCIYIPALNSQAHAQSYIMENWHPSHTLSHTNRDTPRIAPLHRVQYILTFELQIMSSWTFSDPRFPPAQNLHYARNVMNIQCVLPNSGFAPNSWSWKLICVFVYAFNMHEHVVCCLLVYAFSRWENGIEFGVLFAIQN